MANEWIKRLVHGGLQRLGYQVIPADTRGRPESRRISLAQMAAAQAAEVTMEEARLLSELARRAEGPGPIIEIGTLFGWSTRVIGLAKPAAVPFITVDNYSWNPLGLTPEEHEWVTKRILSGLCISGLEVVAADKREFYAAYNRPAPSLAFLDAGHTYEATLEDIQFARRVGARTICGHDYNERDWPGVVQAVRESGGPSQCVGTLWVL